MKLIKYLAIPAIIFAVASCDKHEILFNTELAPDAEFQLHYFEPVIDQASNYIDSVFVNDVLYSSVDGAGQLVPYNGVPGGATGRFFSITPGQVNFKFYRAKVEIINGKEVRTPELVYNQTVTLNAGKQNVFVYDLNEAPVVVDNQYPYWDPSTTTANAETFGTDSIAKVMFCNFMYENDASGNLVPYPGKLQYQWRDPRSTSSDPVWHNVGEPVAFGEVTERTVIKVVKSVFNSSGYCRIDYRILDENGNILRMINSSGNEVNYSDWWNAYIGRSYMHIFGGIRNPKFEPNDEGKLVAVEPTVAVRVWTSL